MQGLRHQSGNNHRTNNSRVWKKLLKCWYTENVTDSVFFIVCEKYLFWFYRSVGFEGNIKYAIKRNYITHGMCWPCNFHFRYVTNEIAHFVSLFLQKLPSQIYLQFCEYFLWVWVTKVNYLAVFSKWVKRFEEKLSICWGKQELARTCTTVRGEQTRNYLDKFLLLWLLC